MPLTDIAIKASKAWSQSFSHENLSTTLTCYGKVSSERQSEVISGRKTGAKNKVKLSDGPNPANRVLGCKLPESAGGFVLAILLQSLPMGALLDSMGLFFLKNIAARWWLSWR